MAALYAAKHGVDWVGDASVDGYDLETARNKIVREVLPLDANGVVWIDSDMVVEQDQIVRLVSHAKDHPFVSGVAHQRKPIHNPCIFHYDEARNVFAPYDEYPANVATHLDGTGFSFVWTSIDLLKEIQGHPNFDEKEGWFPLKKAVGGFQEDLEFCLRARWVGVRPLVDTSLLIGHLGDPPVIGREDYVREREIWRRAR
jgi:hypothetical protein